jgi:NADPH:quinone reductase-like Zn-dependent oxidoreductase
LQAVVYHRYGPPDELTLQEVPTPAPAADEILIKIKAASVNRSDWEVLTGTPLYARIGGLFKPGKPILGSDIAGTVAAAGPSHTRFKPGDEVFGDILGHLSGFAEYVCVKGTALALKPPGLSFEAAAALPQAGVIALQAIHEQGQVQAGHKVLLNGAGGGGGTFALQLAKRRGAEVTAVDHGGKRDFLRALGADHFVDYTQQDFTRLGQQYDLILDLVAHRSALALPRALRPGGQYLYVGGAVPVLFQMLLLGPLIRRMTGKHVRLLMAQTTRERLEQLAALVMAGELAPAIGRRLPLSGVPEALRLVGAGQANGKIVITLDGA